MIAGCSVVGSTGSFVDVAGGAGSFLALGGGAGSFVAQGVDYLVVGGTGYSVAGDTRSFGGISLVDFADLHPSPLLCALLHFCKWGNVVPMSNFLWPA